jgi:hypothetical protein
MKYWFWFILIIIGFSGCQLFAQKGKVTNSSIQAIDMGKFSGLWIIEIASINYLEATAQTQDIFRSTDIDKENFSESLIQSLQKSNVRILPSAQTKIHIDFTQFGMSEDTKYITMTIKANVSVSRNGIITRKVIEIDSKSIRSSKDNGIKMFILEIGNLLREQSFFKR